MTYCLSSIQSACLIEYYTFSFMLGSVKIITTGIFAIYWWERTFSQVKEGLLRMFRLYSYLLSIRKIRPWHSE
jgi:hypothetical protein